MAFDLTMGGQFALIPAKVLYDDHIPATAKLLYGEIYRLSHANGYCYATNKDFMALLQRSENTVRDLINALESSGYIRVKLIRRFGATGDIVQRRIFIGQTLAPEDQEDPEEGIPENWDTSPGKLGDRPPENCGTSPRKLGDPPPENCGPTYKKKNKNKKRVYSPPSDLWDRCTDFCEGDKDLEAALLGFLESRCIRKNPLATGRALSILLNKLKKLSEGDHAVMIAMLDKAVLKNWDSVFPLKPDEMPKASSQAFNEDGEDGI